jgi:hypothetical protein
MGSARDQAGDMGDIGDEDRLGLAGDLREGLELNCARDRGAAAEDQLRALAQRQVADLIEIGPTGVAADPVLNRAEPPPGDRDVPAVRQVPAHRHRHPHHCVAGLA